MELLVLENQRLKQELKSCKTSEFQNLDASAESCGCSHCPHSQVHARTHALHIGLTDIKLLALKC